MSRPQRRLARPARLLVEALETRQLLATFVVANTNDSGAGSLRQAMLDANADSASSTATYPETINFAIPGTGTPTIAPTSPLPTLTHATTIDATTQSGSKSTIGVILDGVNAVAADGSPVNGLNFGTSGFADVGLVGGGASGLEIIRFSGSAIINAGPSRVFNDLAIGSDLTGQPNLGNGGYGIEFDNVYGGNVISNSVIAHNGLAGIVVADDIPGGLNFNAYTATNVTQTDNATTATLLKITTSTGAQNAANVPYGSTQTLTYTITNAGKYAATDVIPSLSEEPENDFATIQSVTTSQGQVLFQPNPSSNSGRLANLGTIAPGASATVTVVVQVRAQASGNANDGANFILTANAPQITYNPDESEAYYTLAAPGVSLESIGTPTTLPIEVEPIVVEPTPVDTTTAPGTISNTLAFPTPVDLAVTAAGPTPTYVANQVTTQLFQISNSGGAATDVVVTFDLTGLPAGSVATLVPVPIFGTGILTVFNGPEIPALTPVPGQPGVYQADLGFLNAGSTEKLNLAITPTSGRALAFQVSASDHGATLPDPTPLNNMVLVSAPLASAGTSTSTVSVTARNLVQVDLTTALPRAQVQKLSHYQLTTTDGTTVPIRSVGYNTKTHKVTLRLAHPLPVGTTQAKLTITGLSNKAVSTLSHARPGRHR